jgi:hypothetical protein
VEALKMKNALLLIIISLSLFAAGRTGIVSAQAGQGQASVKFIDFYGYVGLDVDKVRAALPIHEGDQFTSPEALDGERPRIEAAVRRATGRPAAEVSFVSAGQGVVFVYIGLSGRNVKSFPFNRRPKGDARLPAEALDVQRQANDALFSALERGFGVEDDSKGFALSRDDETARAKQLAMHEYAARHEGEIRAVLRSSADDEQRRVAAQMLGYANQSARQIADLVWASHDPDEYVRNNATRALFVLANSDPKTAARIPAAGFIDMLNSGIWTDRNKASGLLSALSRWRTPRLLAAMRARAFDSLVEMARWRETGHANSARMILGRMGGIEEMRLNEIVGDNAQVDVIINAARRKR